MLCQNIEWLVSALLTKTFLIYHNKHFCTHWKYALIEKKVEDITHNCLRTVWLCTVFTVRQ